MSEPMRVWTGLTALTEANGSCEGFTAASGGVQGVIGDVSLLGSNAFSLTAHACALAERVLCVEVAP